MVSKTIPVCGAKDPGYSMSNRRYTIKVTSLDAFDISFGTLGSKIIPSVQDVERTEHLAQRSHAVQPYPLDFFVTKKRKEFVDVVNIKIEQYVLNQSLVGNGFHSRHVVRPEAILFL